LHGKNRSTTKPVKTKKKSTRNCAVTKMKSWSLRTKPSSGGMNSFSGEVGIDKGCPSEVNHSCGVKRKKREFWGKSSRKGEKKVGATEIEENQEKGRIDPRSTKELNSTIWKMAI